jgi:hypothetical protein
MEIIAYVFLYFIFSLIFYVILIWDKSVAELRKNDRDLTLVLDALMWPLVLFLLPFKIITVVHEYYKTRKKAQ